MLYLVKNPSVDIFVTSVTWNEFSDKLVPIPVKITFGSVLYKC